MIRPTQVTNPAKNQSHTQLSSKVEKTLLAYVAAATAAGVGMLFNPPAAEGKIVYTPANVMLNNGSSFPLDLDHNGIVDFYLVRREVQRSMSALQSSLSVCHVPGTSVVQFCSTAASATNALNAVRAVTTSSRSFAAAALQKGAIIQPGNKFLNKQPAFMGERKFYFSTQGATTATNWFGPWMNKGKGVKNRYLGLKFKINGKFHFGWARLKITTAPKQAFTAILTGYAYETIAGKGIVAGQTKGPQEIDGPLASAIRNQPVRQTATLGLLALGMQGLSIWRREASADLLP